MLGYFNVRARSREVYRINSSRLVACAAISSLLAAVPAWAQISYVPNSLAQSLIEDGPWTLHESGAFQHDASGIVPPSTVPPPPPKYGTPYKGYCTNGELSRNHGLSVMQPYYFPFVRRLDPILIGFFDYRPRNEQEATVAAISADWGATWIFPSESLALNPYCPAYPTDPDNNYVIVNGVKTPYGLPSANGAQDNGLGHAFELSVKGNGASITSTVPTAISTPISWWCTRFTLRFRTTAMRARSDRRRATIQLSNPRPWRQPA